MIYIIPVLVSDDIDDNVAAVIGKSIERLVLIYSLDIVLNSLLPRWARRIMKVAEKERTFKINKPGLERLVSSILRRYGLKPSSSLSDSFKIPWQLSVEKSQSGSDFPVPYSPPSPKGSYLLGRGRGNRGPCVGGPCSSPIPSSTPPATGTAEPHSAPTIVTELYPEPTWIVVRLTRSELSDVATSEKVKYDFGPDGQVSMSSTEELKKSKVGTQEVVNVILGVKCVFFKMPAERITEVLVSDITRPTLLNLFVLAGRRITKKLYRIWRKIYTSKLVRAFTSGTPPSLEAMVHYKPENFKLLHVILSRQSIQDYDLLAPGKPRFRAGLSGWTNLCVVDNVSTTVYFCVQPFKDLCTAVSYRILFANMKLSSDIVEPNQLKNPIFSRIGVSRKRLLNSLS